MIPITRTIENSAFIAQPPCRVWAVLADFGGVAKWAPRMKGSRITSENAYGVGTRRVMRHVWGFRIVETVTHWDEGSGFTFRLDRAPAPLRGVVESWCIEQEGAGTRVRTRVSYGTGWAVLGRWVDRWLVRFLVEREMASSLRSLCHFADYRFHASTKPAAADQDSQ